MLESKYMLTHQDKIMKNIVDDLSISPIVQLRNMSWMTYDYALMCLSYHDIAVLGYLDSHDM